MSYQPPCEPPTRQIPYAQYSQVAPEPQPHPPAKKVGRWPWILLVVGLLVAGSGGWAIYDRLIRKDSGIAACEALRDGNKSITGEKANDKKITEAEYREIRAVFEDSRHDDIRDHGTKLMDIAWQLTNLGEDPGMGALAYLGPLTTHATGLQSACADQGIIVDLNLNK